MCRWRIFTKLNVCKVALLIFVVTLPLTLWTFLNEFRRGGVSARWDAERALLAARSDALGVSVAEVYVRAADACRTDLADRTLTFDQAHARMNAYSSEGQCMRAWAYPPAELEWATQWRSLVHSLIGLGIVSAIAAVITIASMVLLLSASWVHGKGLRLLANWLTS